MPSDCPNESCRCTDWPPEECPVCGVRAMGFTSGDWRQHFIEDCHSLGRLYCFVMTPEETLDA